jgi:hypothetical protein
VVYKTFVSGCEIFIHHHRSGGSGLQSGWLYDSVKRFYIFGALEPHFILVVTCV